MAVPPHVLADELKRLRLEDRARRLDAVAGELRKRARKHPAPWLIRRAIAGFDHELRAVRRELTR